MGRGELGGRQVMKERRAAKAAVEHREVEVEVEVVKGGHRHRSRQVVLMVVHEAGRCRSI
jgi:hypothetical protein